MNIFVFNILLNASSLIFMIVMSIHLTRVINESGVRERLFFDAKQIESIIGKIKAPSRIMFIMALAVMIFDILFLLKYPLIPFDSDVKGAMEIVFWSNICAFTLHLTMFFYICDTFYKTVNLLSHTPQKTTIEELAVKTEKALEFDFEAASGHQKILCNYINNIKESNRAMINLDVDNINFLVNHIMEKAETHLKIQVDKYFVDSTISVCACKRKENS